MVMENLPGDFRPVDGCVPEWIDIAGICGESKRFVGLYAINGFEVLAINNGRVIFTTADRNGEFRKRFFGAVKTIGFDEPPGQQAQAPSSSDAVLVYDCEARKQWIAPRYSAVRFLYQQF